ncbi:hypothetical protein CPB83DRAFT_256716 [Crepidotus variabilis]|uniref:F-box domain-containing protein n=1 Tax=Crepidotus variabilis TaxID=179855 RepID=A0A9P6JR43_9AGAR|nr:hypothetical protein CPB83DRAFT_256716 [Crepidotus variabilis]
MIVDILQLPPEVIEGIGHRLEPPENRKLRLVCQQIRQAIEPQAFETLYLTKRDLPWLLKRLEAYGSQTTRVGLFVKTLVIHIPTTGQETGMGRLKELFQRAIFSLRNVKALSWISGDLDPPWIVNILLAHIHSIVMEHFQVYINYGHTNFGAFKNIQNLRSFSFRSWPFTDAKDMSYASQIILNSPRLSNLKISTSCYTATSTAPRLHDFLPPRGCDPLPLETLALECLRILLDDITLPHFRSLKYLRIRNNLVNPEFGSTYTQIWDTLRQESIHLTTIDCNLGIVEEGLMAYLMSYQGTKSLEFDSEHQWYDSKKADVVAHRFFLEVVPKICQSLERLIVNTHISNGWCFSEETSEAFKSCKRLRELQVSIDVVGNETTESFEKVASGLKFLEKRTSREAIPWVDPWSKKR